MNMRACVEGSVFCNWCMQGDRGPVGIMMLPFPHDVLMHALHDGQDAIGKLACCVHTSKAWRPR